MIGRLSGRIVERQPGRILLDVGGVGYAVQIPLSTFYALSDGDGETTTLQIHTHVREESLELYGFATAEERGGFEQLIGISGVGPKLALAILSGIGADELRLAVAGQDRQRLQRIPGVGRKTAERLLLELRDKFAVEPPTPGSAAAASGPKGGTEGELRRADAVSALVNLGYTRERAAQAVDAARENLDDPPELEELLKASLRRLVR
jgi:Holliday junction DNA helicase RuvA